MMFIWLLFFIEDSFNFKIKEDVILPKVYSPDKAL